MGSIYLLSLKQNNVVSPLARDTTILDTKIADFIRNSSLMNNATDLEVRVGYRGMCMIRNGYAQTCSTSASRLSSILKVSLDTGKMKNNSTSPDLFNLIHIGQKFQEEIVFDGLM